MLTKRLPLILSAATLALVTAASLAHAQSPLGIGTAEPSFQPTGGPFAPLFLYVNYEQQAFYRALTGALKAMRQDPWQLASLIGLSFAYGVFHAAGPGHGKGVISAYLVADEKALRKGFALSLAAALVQALVAIAIVAIVSLALRATAATMNKLAMNVELASFLAVALLGAVFAWRKAGKFLGVVALARNPYAAVQDDCDHVHMPPPEELGRLTRLRDMAGVALAAGIRPCAGALIVLVFALSQGVFAAGIAATFAMALGTALTTGAIAALAVFFKAAALRIAGGRGASGAIAIAGLELLAAAFVFVLGASLLYGLWAAG